MKLFCGVGMFGSLVLVGLAGCSSAAQEASKNTAPVAQQVTLSTSTLPAYIGTVLQGSYHYADSDGDGESGTVKVWLRDGEPIKGANQDNYTATVQDSGKKLHYRVTPAAASGKTPGAAVMSSAITIENSPPGITGLVIGNNLSGTVDTGVKLTASYSFQDLDGDGEGASTYQWRRDGVAIGDAHDKTYTPTYLDVGTTIAVAVTPYAHTGANRGLPVVSNAVKVAPPNAVLTVSSGLKQLHFSWVPVRGASSYRVRYNPDGVSEFVLLAVDSDNLTATDYDWNIAVHRINWPRAQFMLDACDSSGCVKSASISALDVMLGTIGYFKASNTGISDNFGYSVALSGDGNTLAVGAYFEDSAMTGATLGAPSETNAPNDIVGYNSGAVYVFTRSGATWSQQAYVKASNTGVGDYFGSSVALSADGDILAVGAPNEDSDKFGVIPGAPGDAATGDAAIGADSGAVHVYSRAGTMWLQQAYVKASNTGTNDHFGTSVALSGDGLTLAVGAPYEDSDKFGVIPGAPGEAATADAALGKDSGAVYVYAHTGAVWSQQAYIKTSNTGALDSFGGTVVLSGDGNTLAIGAQYEDSDKPGVIPGAPDETTTGNAVSFNSGAMYVYARVGVAWSQQAYVKASNTGFNDSFGWSVALSADGDTLAVGAKYEGSGKRGVIPGAPDDTETGNLSSNSGAVYVYARTGVAWSQQAYVKASNTGVGDLFGYSVALSADGHTLAVGAPVEDADKLGTTLGAPDETATGNSTGNLNFNSGAVYVYTRTGAAWLQQAYVKASNTAAGNVFGWSVALSGDGHTLAVGAYGEGSVATGVNNTAPGQGDNSAPEAGAVYLY